MNKLFYIISIMILLTTYSLGQYSTDGPNNNKPDRYFDQRSLLAEVIDDSIDALRIVSVDSAGVFGALAASGAGASYDSTTSSDFVTIVGDSVGYDAYLNAKRVVVINGQVFHYTAGTSIEAINTALADSLSIVFPMASYHYLSLDSYIGATVDAIIIKMFRTNDNGASNTDPYDGNWIPVSVKFLGASDETGITVTNSTLNANYENTSPVTAEKYMIRVTFTGATNTYKFVDKRSY